MGNRLTMIKGSETATYGYDSGGDDRLTSITDNVAGNSSFQYDANGSMTQMTQGTTTTTYGYDLQNRLTSQTVNGTTTTYGYDPNGNRIDEQVGSNSPTWYLVDANNPSGYTQVLQESTTLGGAPTTTYTLGQSVLAQANSSGTSTYLLADGRGSTRLTTDPSGIITGRYDYDAFGNANNFNPASALTKYLYDNQQYDSTLGQYYLRARYYLPTDGRFTSGDSYRAKAGDLTNANLYLYVAGYPVNAADPNGHEFTVTELLTVGGLVAGGAYGAFLPAHSAAERIQHIVTFAGLGALTGLSAAVYLTAAFPALAADVAVFQNVSQEVESESTVALSEAQTEVLERDTQILNTTGSVGVSRGELLRQQTAARLNSDVPGIVRGENITISGYKGVDLTEIDIVTPEAMVEVKAGPQDAFVNDILRQYRAQTLLVNPRPVIIYGPDLSSNVLRTLRSAGVLVTTDYDELLQVIRP